MGKAEVREFLESKGSIAQDWDMDLELERMLKSMNDGLAGATPPEAMLMIPTYLTLSEDAQENEPVIVLDAGGTNFRVGLANFIQNNVIDLSKFNKVPMPGSDGEISKDEFYTFLADQIEPLLEFSNKIGFCFSYPAEVLPNKDAKILGFTKEVRIPEAAGTVIGEEIKSILAARGHVTDDLKFVVLNDTVAALLGGVTRGKDKRFSGYASIVLGTGINSAFLSNNSEITKLEGKIDPLAKMIINMESGNYNVSHQNIFDQLIDEASTDVGAQTFEKMISGRYLGLQAHATLEAACEETDIFTDFFKENFASIDQVKSSDMTVFFNQPYGTGILSQCCANELDRENLYLILDNILERAAKLVTVLITAMHINMDAGKNPVKPLAITVEGTTFFKMDLFREKLKSHIKTFTNEKHGYYNVFLMVENANIVGSALAALMN